MTTSIETRWLPTGQAARELGISPDSLKRYADRDEVLLLGEHWRHGVHSNSPRVWNLPLCLQALNRRGRLQRGRLQRALRAARHERELRSSAGQTSHPRPHI